MYGSRTQSRVEIIHWSVWLLLAALIALAIVAHTAGNPATDQGAQEPPKPTALIVSPCPGLFQTGEMPGGAPFVNVGAQVEAATVVGKIEPLIMQRPGSRIAVTASVSGTIARVLVADGQMVSFGQPLFEVLPAGK